MWNDLKLGASTARFRKVAAIVGAVLGRYHPHGDSACHEALVRLAQPFTMRYPFVDGHGNFGSQDGDGPAAARYIEAKLLQSTSNLLFTSDSDMSVVTMEANYDQTAEEPCYLPPVIPTILLNGANGIAVGLSTNIPPHNLGEVTKAFVAYVQARSKGKSEADAFTTALTFIQAPDFPTGGNLVATRDEIESLYKEGKATLTLESKWIKDGNSIIFTEIPYGVAKADLVERVANTLEADKALNAWVTEWADESSDIIRLRLDLKKGAPESAVLEELFKKTPLREKLSFSLTFLLNDMPGKYTLGELFEGFYQWRLTHVATRINYDKTTYEASLDLKVSLQKAILNKSPLLEVLQKDGLTSVELKREVQNLLGVSEAGANYVLNTRLSSLSRVETSKLEKEIEVLTASIQNLVNISQDLHSVLISEAKALIKSSDDRRTLIVDPPKVVTVPTLEQPSEDTFVVLSKHSWARRQKTVPTDLSKIRVRDADSILLAASSTTKDMLGFVTSTGRLHLIKVDTLEVTSGFGSPMSLNLGFQDGESILYAFVTNNHSPSLAFLSKEGRLCKVDIKDIDLSTHTRVAGRPIMRLEEGDTLIHVGPLPDGPALLGMLTPSSRLYCVDFNELASSTPPSRGKDPLKMLERDFVSEFFWNSKDQIKLSSYKKSNFSGGKSVMLTSASSKPLNPSSSQQPITQVEEEDEDLFGFGIVDFED
jgi:DNA gyrase subunit A